ncbi:MAG: alpha-amylase [Pseudomonadales bacterium]|nr:glycoside hydrolase family 57 protein [Candidatus Woesebacteria bacterium]MCB9802088.1 alpha-amylase [Pseudomonadales bacterium]
MAKVCWYFHLHQPFRLAAQDVFSLGKNHEYFSADNAVIFQKVVKKSYLPMLTLLLELCQAHPQFVCALSLTGVFLEQASEYAPEVLVLLQQLVATGQVELLAETYHHTLASLYSTQEFNVQVHHHLQLLDQLFAYTPTVFRNTELIYQNEIGSMVAQLGFIGLLTEAVPRYLDGREKTRLYRSVGDEALPLLLKQAELSDDIAFRFSDKQWSQYPLTAQTYLEWLDNYRDDELINLFMDFETFGEHQWADTGIFSFFQSLNEMLIANKAAQLVTPSMVLTPLTKKQRCDLPVYDVPEPISWADVDRDITAWIENSMQQDALKQLYALEKIITTLPRSSSAKGSVTAKHIELLSLWRNLQTSDHFYYMCTKWAADGDVHAYFSPYQDPYEAYRNFCIALRDLSDRVKQ